MHSRDDHPELKQIIPQLVLSAILSAILSARNNAPIY